MGNIRSGLLAAAVGIAVLAPQAASANVITQTFTITQSSPVSLPGSPLAADPPLLAEFNPADGMLTSIDESLTGTATWTSNVASPNLVAVLLPGALVGGFFDVSGPITFLSGSTTNPSILNEFTGTGSVVVELGFSTLDLGDTFATSASGLAGALTYNYTPAVPEPSTWAMMALGFAGLGFLGHRKTRSDNALGVRGGLPRGASIRAASP